MALIDFAPTRKTEKLSRVPSVLIGQVCDDMETVLGLKGVRLRMTVCGLTNGECEVCAAGAVILCRAPRKKLRTNVIDRYKFSDGIRAMMGAVNDLRRGDVCAFLKLIGAPDVAHLCSPQCDEVWAAKLTGTPSVSEVRAWITAARKLAARLKEIGK